MHFQLAIAIIYDDARNTSKLPLTVMLNRELVQDSPHPRGETQNLEPKWSQLAGPLVIGSLSSPRGAFGESALQ